MTAYRLIHKLSLILLLVAFGSVVAAQQRSLPAGTDGADRAAHAAEACCATRSSGPLASGPRTSPFNPPEANDHSFVTDAAPKLDTGCIFRSSGPIVYNIEITRHAGELNADGTLKNAAALVAAGLLSPTATLIMPAFDVDSGAVLAPPDQPERDRLSFNGEVIGFLSGENNQWKLNSFEIPIGKVKFAARGGFNQLPSPALNEVRIDIDTANADELWCTSIDWGAQSFKAMSPIILIHGNNSNGAFFERQGFVGYLQSQKLLYDNSINNPTDFIAANGNRLDGQIPGIAKSFGVDSVHFVVHSKGGLDSREYLAVYQPGHDSELKILSYSSLSTPQNGSVLADLAVERDAAAAAADKIEFVGFPTFTATLLALAGLDNGTRNLTTTFVGSFNAGNLSRLPSNTVFNTVAADADTNGNNRIDRTPDEYAELRQESTSLRRIEAVSSSAARRIVDTMYQILRNTSAVTVTYRTDYSLLFGTRTIATITAVPNATPLGNDTLVTIPSGHGNGSLAARTVNTATFNGGAGRNHSNVANAGVAARVVTWIISTERSGGDLK